MNKRSCVVLLLFVAAYSHTDDLDIQLVGLTSSLKKIEEAFPQALFSNLQVVRKKLESLDNQGRIDFVREIGKQLYALEAQDHDDLKQFVKSFVSQKDAADIPAWANKNSNVLEDKIIYYFIYAPEKLNSDILSDFASELLKQKDNEKYQGWGAYGFSLLAHKNAEKEYFGKYKLDDATDWSEYKKGLEDED